MNLLKASLLLLSFCFAFQLQAQNCCQGTAKKCATTSFAKLGEGKDFQNAHPIPASLEGVKFKGEMISLKVENEAEGNAYLVKAKTESKKYLFVFQEWWGLNDYVKREADRLHKALGGKVNVIAIDLYDGKIATTRAAASELMQAAKKERSEALIQAAIKLAGNDAQIATIGWCFGGGWSLQAALIAGQQTKACVMYYGMPEKEVERLKNLNTDVLAIYATKDRWINKDVAEEFETNMKAANKQLTSLFFEADHAFCNPSNPQYEAKEAKEANKKAVEYLKKALL
jgi:carboxymethylenebutenolidase